MGRGAYDITGVLKPKPPLKNQRNKLRKVQGSEISLIQYDALADSDVDPEVVPPSHCPGLIYLPSGLEQISSHNYHERKGNQGGAGQS